MRCFGLMWMTMALAAAAAGGAPMAIVCTQAPAASGATQPNRSGEGGHIVLATPGGVARNLTPGFASAADPSVSFDGSHILFAAKKNVTDSWDIYEMAADGSGARQITHNLGNCRSPVYQSKIFYIDDPGPMAQIAFVSDVDAESGEWGAARPASLYSARVDGSGVRRLTYNPSGVFDPAMLPDGRMLFSAWRTRTAGRPGAVDLFGVNIDGTDFAAFSGVQGRRTKRMPCVTARREVIFVDHDAAGPDGAGPLASISLQRNLHSWRPLTLPADGAFLTPAPLPDGAVLVARKPAHGNGTYGIWQLDPATRKLEPVFDTPGNDEWQAQALAPRDVPDGRSSVVDEKQPWAKLYCLNIYESDLDARNWQRGL
ncbi:MAG TPA: hypothetical protein VHA11_15040, partial [Bryobacteraceae bacterium]|nr:hypothetical protein [Bryobacteraceae bacterium]